MVQFPLGNDPLHQRRVLVSPLARAVLQVCPVNHHANVAPAQVEHESPSLLLSSSCMWGCLAQHEVGHLARKKSESEGRVAVASSALGSHFVVAGQCVGPVPPPGLEGARRGGCGRESATRGVPLYVDVQPSKSPPSFKSTPMSMKRLFAHEFSFTQ